MMKRAFSVRRKENKEDTGARCVMITDDRENKSYCSCRPLTPLGLRKLFTLTGGEHQCPKSELHTPQVSYILKVKQNL